MASFGADLGGLSRLQALGAQRAKATGRTAPNGADLDWMAKQATPAEVVAWATPEGFAALESGMKQGAKGEGGDMAKRTAKKGIGRRIGEAVGILKPKAGKARRGSSRGGAASTGVVSVPLSAMGAPPSSRRRGPSPKKGIGARIKSAIGLGPKPATRRAASSGGRSRARVALPTSQGLALYEAREVAPGVFEAEAPRSGFHGIERRGRGGGDMMPSAKGRGMELLTMGGAAIGGGALGFWLQTQAPVTIPMVGWKIRRGSIAFVVGLAITIGTRRRWPKVARHAAALTAGIGAGAAAERVAAGQGLVTQTA